MIFNIFKNKKSPPSAETLMEGAQELPTGEPEILDPKSFVAPSGEKGEHIEYYVFCKDDTSEKDKNFLYHKKVVCDCRSLEEAEKLAKMFSVHYQHYALAYNATTHDIVSEVHEGSKKLFLARIKEYREAQEERLSVKAQLAALIAVKSQAKS